MTNQEIAKYMFPLIRAELFGTDVPEELVRELDTEKIQAIFYLSKFHDLAHLTGNALSALDVLDEEAEKHFGKYQYLAIYRYQRILHELSVLRGFFEEEKIPFMPLKGTVLRDYYPDPTQRTSCDIDILIHPEDLERATEAIQKKLSYSITFHSTHDTSFATPSELVIELHYSLYGSEDERTPKMGDVWSFSHVKEGSTYEYVMDMAFFYGYFITHAAKHFHNGGCGIRTFIDIAVMKRLLPYDRALAEELLAKAGVLEFSRYCDKLASYWFLGEEADEVVLTMEEFVLRGGTFGCIESHVASVYRTNNWFVYAVKRLFPPVSNLARHYPVLKKAAILYPVYLVVHWCDVLFSGRAKHAARHVKAVKNGDREKNRRYAEMHKTLHLE